MQEPEDDRFALRVEYVERGQGSGSYNGLNTWFGTQFFIEQQV